MSGYCEPTLCRVIHPLLVVSPGRMSGYCRPTLCRIIHPQLVVSPGEPDVRSFSAHPLPRHTSSAGGESW